MRAIKAAWAVSHRKYRIITSRPGDWGADQNRYFAGEVVGNILGLEPRKWLRPRPIDRSRNQERAKALGTSFQPFNWTLQLQAQ